MVRTRGGHRYRPRVRFNTAKRNGAGTSRAVDAHSPDQVVETPPALTPASMSEDLQDSGDLATDFSVAKSKNPSQNPFRDGFAT